MKLIDRNDTLQAVWWLMSIIILHEIIAHKSEQSIIYLPHQILKNIFFNKHIWFLFQSNVFSLLFSTFCQFCHSVWQCRDNLSHRFCSHVIRPIYIRVSWLLTSCYCRDWYYSIKFSLKWLSLRHEMMHWHFMATMVIPQTFLIFTPTDIKVFQ